MKVPFVKMQGCGNDYIYFNCFRTPIAQPEELSVRLSDRHFGIGGDGIILICPSQHADLRMRMFNADGSEGKMCGNAIRCVGKYAYETGLVPREKIDVETLSGTKHLSLHLLQGSVQGVTVDMGAAIWSPQEIPANFPGERAVKVPLSVGGVEYCVTCVSMGNPHCVVFGGDPYALPLEQIGPLFERHSAFPEQVNTEFVQVLAPNVLKMRVWERGSGETWACGTGACAVTAAAVANGLCEEDTDITVKLRGGDLVIRYTTDTVWMTGEAKITFEGEVEI
ncbi:MAG: diaminopimelate epimerase [Eubacteriales bacterium]|nr:diaminopimelate epimerase [Eubacteriales bacterium]